MKWYLMGTKDEIERLIVQAHSDIELFVKNFAKKYRPLFTNGSYAYRIHPSIIPEIDFPYEVYLEIKIK